MHPATIPTLMPTPTPTPPSPPPPPEPTLWQIVSGYLRDVWKHLTAKINDPKAAKRTDAVLIAASVIAAMNYQAVISPPRGLYQETRYNHFTNQVYIAGEAIGAYLDPPAYKNFYLANTVSFTSSMSTMFLLLCGVTLQRRIFSMLTTATMFAAITATAYSYAVALQSITPSRDAYLEKSWLYVQKIVTMAVLGWLVVATLIFIWFLETQYRGAPTHRWFASHFRALRMRFSLIMRGDV